MSNQRGHSWNGHGFSKCRVSRDEHIEMQNYLTEWMRKMVDIRTDILESSSDIESIKEYTLRKEVKI